MYFITYIKWPCAPNLKSKLGVWYSVPYHKLIFGKYISPLFDKRGNSHIVALSGVSFTESVTAVWMKDNYIRYFKFEELRSEECFIELNFSLCKKVKVN